MEPKRVIQLARIHMRGRIKCSRSEYYYFKRLMIQAGGHAKMRFLEEILNY